MDVFREKHGYELTNVLAGSLFCFLTIAFLRDFYLPSGIVWKTKVSRKHNG